jgi:hypothetical protein
MSTSRISLKFLIILVALGCARMEDGGAEAPTSKVASVRMPPPPEQAPANAFPTTVMPEVVDAPARGPAAGDERRYHALEATGQGIEVQEAARDFVETTRITVEEKAEEKPKLKAKLEAKKMPKPLELLAGRNQPAADIAGDLGSDFDDDLRLAKEVDKKQDQGEGEEAPEKLRLELNAGELDFETDDGKRDAPKDDEGRMGGRATGRFGEQAATRDLLANGEGLDGLEDFGTRRPDAGLLDDGWIADAPTRPAAFLPSMFYFENTYLGRSAQFIERLRRLDAAWPGEGPYRLATLPPQGVDPPDDKGLSLSVALDRTSIDQPGKVYLQVTLQGSSRFGWRRPPLDVAVVIDAGAAGRRPEQVVGALQRLLATLGPQDRLGVVLAGEPPVVLAEVGDLRETRRALGRLGGRSVGGPLSLRAAMHTAGERLQAASQGQARVPGAQTVLVIVDGEAGAEGAVGAAHELTVQGATTSVIELGGAWAWWPVANAGHGNLHRVEDGDVAAAVDAELARISQVIARLLRVNIRLAPKVHAVRVLGSRVLEADEVRRVKAREEATDRQLSATLGVKADRGDDDDGIQTVIPFFYGGDAHVIAVELWVEGPGPVAEISLKYKDMVALENATAQAGARIGGVAKPTTQAELAVRRNVRGFLVAEALDEAGRLVARGAHQDAVDLLTRTQAGAGSDAALLAGFRQALQQPQVGFDVLSEALGFAGQRRISHVALRSTQ